MSERVLKYNLEALFDDYEEEHATIDNLHACGEQEAEERHEGDLEGFALRRAGHELTDEGSDERTEDEAPGGEHEEACHETYHRTSGSLLASATDIGEPHGSNIVENGDDDQKDAIDP